jgi:hypothetical protein
MRDLREAIERGGLERYVAALYARYARRDVS